MAEPIEWSPAVRDLVRSCVDLEVWNHPRTDLDEDVLLGYPFAEIREQVLVKELTDFRLGHQHPTYGALTADEKVLLYCYVNMKRHFFACLATFQTHRAALEALFAPGQRPLVFDLGSGPGTVFLALCDLLPNREFDYFGIDSAAAMHARAQTLWEAGKGKGLISKGSTAAFRPSWEAVALDHLPKPAGVLLTCSYFFASHTLTYPALRSLAEFVKRLRGLGCPIIWVYINSTNDLANRNYEIFKDLLGLNPDDPSPIELTVEFRKKPNGPPTREQFVHELLQW